MRTLTRLAALGAALVILLSIGVNIGTEAAGDPPPATLGAVYAPQAPPSTLAAATTLATTSSTTATTTAPTTTLAPTTSSTTTTHVHPAPAPPPAPAPTVAPAAPPVPPPTPAPAGQLPSILVAIRGCESGHDYTARNPRSSASGAFQFIDSTWRAYGDSRWTRAYLAPREVQDAAALRLYQASGTSPWNASRSCWG